MQQEFDLGNALREVLSDGLETPCIFDRLMVKFEKYSDRPAGSLYEMKRRDNRAAKGLAWEKFCQWYLLNVQSYYCAWLWKEIPEEIRIKLGLTMRNDNGIDMVAKKYKNGGYTAIQCKYKNKQIAKGRKTVKVTWKTLSTFVALTARTAIDVGGWDQHIVMTNCSGVGKWEIPRTSKDKTIAYGTFKNLKRADCTIARSLKEEIYKEDEVVVVEESIKECIKEKEESTSKILEDVRAARLAHFKII